LSLRVVTDGLNYSSANGFGLTQFVDTLAASPIHGMIPIVVRASRGADPTADISNFDFTNPTNGLIKARYDVVFLFGISSEGQNQLPASGRSGLQDPRGTDTPDLVRIRQYYRNLGTWLMPKKVRKCLRFPLIVAEAARFPLFEELRVPPLDSATTGEELHRIGTQVAAALAVRRRHGRPRSSSPTPWRTARAWLS